MADWPLSPSLPGDLLVLSAFSIASAIAAAGQLGSAASTAWPVANKALLLPFRLSQPIVIQKLFVSNGTAVSGNLDLGIYDRTGTRLLSTGSTAQAGVSGLQAITVTATRLARGWYYWALSLDNTTGTVIRSAPTGGLATLQVLGCAEAASSFPLPATLTPATVVANFYPMLGMFARSAP